MFASKGVAEHIMRGIVGFGALAGVSMLAVSQPWLSLGLVPVALVALRGCPMCWTLGLVQTVVAVLRGKSTAGLCTDGSCAISPSARAADREGALRRWVAREPVLMRQRAADDNGQRQREAPGGLVSTFRGRKVRSQRLADRPTTKQADRLLRA